MLIEGRAHGANVDLRADGGLYADRIRGVAAMAFVLYGDAKLAYRVRYLIEKTSYPAFKDGGLWCIRRSELLQWLENQEKKKTRR